MAMDQVLKYIYDYNLKVNFGEFLSAIREPLSERRLKLVCKVFSFFDLKKEAMVNANDLGK